MKKIVILMMVFLLSLASFCYAKVEIPNTIRIGIYASSNSVSSFTISSESGMEVGTIDSKGAFHKIQDIASGKSITIKKGSGTNSVNVEGIGDVGDSSHYLRILPKSTSGVPLLKVNDTRYRGAIEVRRYSSSDMTVINEVTMQEYLYGVVPREIGGNSPKEAVKAQAIIARTFAAKNYNRRTDLGFNLTDTVSDQAYGGYSWENSNSNRAVDETDGMVAVYNGELIGGYYFSTSGGYTESSVNVWGGEFDYLSAVPDPYEPTDLSKTTWTVTFTASDIEKKLAEKGINIGQVKDLVVTEVSDAGRALSLDVVGTNGTKTYTKANIRSFLGLDSQWFTINGDAPQVPDFEDIVKEEKKEETTKEPEENDEEDDDDDEEVHSSRPRVGIVDLEIATKKDYHIEGEVDDVVVDVIEGDQIVVKSDSGETTTIESDDEKVNNLANEKIENSEADTKDSETDEDTKEKEKEEKPLITKLIGSIRSIRSDSSTILAKLDTKTEDATSDVTVKQVAYGARNTSGVSTFVIQGRGWGHSVGMSQNGAIGMAKNDFSAEEIIKWYYRGVDIVKK